jgi:hypothetical protein
MPRWPWAMWTRRDRPVAPATRLEQHARIAEQWPDYFSLYWRRDGTCRVGAGKPAVFYVVDRDGNLKP